MNEDGEINIEKLHESINQSNIFDESKLNEVQVSLLEHIRAKFDPQNNKADRYILYEITDFKEPCRNFDDFWNEYEDFYEFGYDY